MRLTVAGRNPQISTRCSGLDAVGERLGKSNCAGGIGVLAALFVFVEMELRFDRTYAKNDWPGVQNILDRARWFGRDRADTRRTIARQLYVSGDTQAAIENYQRAIALTSTVRDFGELGWIQQKSGNLEDAEDLYLEGLNRQPEHPLVLLHLGRTQLQSGQTDAAVQTFERLSQIKRASRPGNGPTGKPWRKETA